MTAIGPTHYRFYDTVYDNYFEICLETFEVIKETPRGYWIVPSEAFRIGRWYYEKKKKFVLKDSWKRHCYPTLSEAMNSYRLRKVYDKHNSSNRLKKAELGLEYATKALNLTEADLKELFLFCNERYPSSRNLRDEPQRQTIGSSTHESAFGDPYSGRT